ncbi:hypothetical protein K466DRAFT_262789 [Polyporus arcularius HHB13444]|uniref:Uncharacterized protein n=1 Tax=Polyporus arcularius HHB13444 TaxID=1314778 RepID=A0A5C3P2E2_9APHY|nr:hypothetical protein K466DRAFT_262789 [Polyporus arcularius HHB13444]
MIARVFKPIVARSHRHSSSTQITAISEHQHTPEPHIGPLRAEGGRIQVTDRALHSSAAWQIRQQFLPSPSDRHLLGLSSTRVAVGHITKPSPHSSCSDRQLPGNAVARGGEAIDDLEFQLPVCFDAVRREAWELSRLD